MLRIKGHRGTSETIIFIKHEAYKLKYRFRDMGHPYTIYLPNLNSNSFKYYVTHQGCNALVVFIYFIKYRVYLIELFYLCDLLMFI